MNTSLSNVHDHFDRTSFALWASGEINSNIKRGMLAEYIVASVLGVLEEHHEEWESYDVLFQGVKIEVKSSGFGTPPFLQTKKPPIPKFDIKQREWAWSNKLNDFVGDGTPTRHADIYVFAVSLARTQMDFRPFSKEDWEFFVVPTVEVNRNFEQQKTVSYTSLNRHFNCCKWDQLKGEVERIKGEIKWRPKSSKTAPLLLRI